MCRRIFIGLLALFVLASCWALLATWDDDPLDEAKALTEQASALYQKGNFSEAESLLKRSLDIREHVLGPEHRDIAQTGDMLAGVYVAEGRYADAEVLFRRNMTICEKLFGPDSRETAVTLNNLGLVYKEQGSYSEAESAYARSLAIDEKNLGHEHPKLAATLNNFGVLYESNGRYAKARPLLERSLAIRQKTSAPMDPELAMSLASLAALEIDDGRYSEAERLLRRVSAIFEGALGPGSLKFAWNLDALAGVYVRLGRYSDAESLYKRSLEIRESVLGADHQDVAATCNNLGEIYKQTRRYAEAEQFLKRSLEINEKRLGPDHSNVATILNNLASLYEARDLYTEAEPLYKRSLTIRERTLGPAHPDIAVSLNNLAFLSARQNRYQEAEALYRQSLEISGKAFGPDHPSVAIVLDNFGALYQKQNRYADALGFSRHSISILRKRLSSSPEGHGPSDDSERREHRSRLLRNISLLYAAKEPGAPVESFEILQLAEVSSAAAAVTAATARLATGSDDRAAMIRERQDLARQSQALDAAILKVISKPPAERNAESEKGMRASLDDTARKLDALDARIAKEFPEYAELSNPKSLSAEEAQALLAPDEALLVYLSADDATWLWVLRRDRIGFHKIELGAKVLVHEVNALRSALDPERNPDFAPFPTKAAYALYQKLLGPALPLLDGVRNALVVPDGALESLPLSVLVTKAPEHDPQTLADHRKIAWLARNYAITVLPAVTSLRALRQSAKAPGARAPFLGVGDPVLEGRPGSERGVRLASLFRGALANPDDVRKLEALPETADELRAIAKTLGGDDHDLLLRESASEPALRQRPLDHYQVIQFATHGLVSGDLPGLAEPALVLSPPKEASPEDDGLLTASKITTLKLNADWVVLSACNTAAGDGTPEAGGLSGLAKAFFYAGARSLLVSHWPVASKATVKLVTDAFAEMKKDPKIGRAEALRRAEMAMLDPKNPPEFAHPLVWAPFILAGEGGAGR